MLILSTLFRFDSGDFSCQARYDSQTAYPTLIFSPFVPRVALIPAITSVVGNPGGRVIRRKTEVPACSAATRKLTGERLATVSSVSVQRISKTLEAKQCSIPP
jgi:hypothetical protein